jgi:hypothetical protein
MYDAMLEDVDASSQFLFRQSKTWNEVNWACLYDFFSMRLKSIEIQPFGIAGFTIASKK